ncbi:hypothetical protein D047_3551A, partial [Vibrio parahaemolyticus VPTS-2010_2]
MVRAIAVSLKRFLY